MNGDGEVDIRDVILGFKIDNFKGPKLLTLTLDGEYSVEEEVKYDKFTYTVQLPAGRPRIPRVTATTDAENATIAYQQATIADDESYGCARVIISDENGNENVYTVKFVRAEAAKNNATIALQYDDRWTFTPDSAATGIEFFSSNPEIAKVDEKGVITALSVTDGTATPVTISAKVGGETIDTLTISRIDKAVINLFLVTGQSNAQGCYDIVDTNNRAVEMDKQLEDVLQPSKAGQVYIYDARPFWNSNNTPTGTERFILPKGTDRFYDLNEVKRSGFASALGKTYYDLSGEKVVFLHAAYNGSSIEEWLDPEKYPTLAEKDFQDKEGLANVNHYVNAQNRYKELLNILDSTKYEINHKANFWLQGETCMWYIWDYNGGSSGKGDWKSPGESEKLFSAEDYSDMFIKVNDQMKADFGIESNNIILVRAHNTSNKTSGVLAAINNVRAAQYGMANNISGITIVSRFSDYTVMNKQPAIYVGTIYEQYVGTMGVADIHYNQTGHNINGITAATNYFKSLDVDTHSVATKVEIIDSNGVDRFEANAVIGEFEVGKTKRIAAFALPEYSLENVIYSSSNEAVAKINNNGLITIVGTGEATITATAESGAFASVVVKGKTRTTVPVQFTLDQDATKSIAKYLPEFRLADITYKSNNEAVATVNAKGLITVVGGGEAKITATSNTGAYEEFVIIGIGKNNAADSVHYRWDFVDGKEYESTYDENSLTKTGDKCTITNGKYQSTSVRGDELKMEEPVVFDTEHNWLIEIEFTTPVYFSNTLIGLENCKDNSTGKPRSHIYFNAYTTAENGYGGIHFLPDVNAGDEFIVPFYDCTAVKNALKSMNKWRIGYEVATDTITVSLYNSTTNTWNEMGKLTSVADFTVTANCLFGDYNGSNYVNLQGTVEYFDIIIESPN
ncbi:MAG: Ig-like domain-containing protein [Clostridia bacterium]|nr:Ig-like domain-containing protein [Clostridia bacterium]